MLTTDIKIQVSKLFTGTVLVTLCASLVIILTLSISAIDKVLLIFLTLGYGLSILWKDCLLKSKYSITSVFLSQQGWQIVRAGEIRQVELCGSSTLSFPVSVLRFKVANQKRKISCVICYDSLAQDNYRQLLVLLRTGHAREAELTRHKKYLLP